MGQAKRRGTREERIKQGIENGQIEQQLAELKAERQRKYRDELANMPRDKKEKLHKTRIRMAGIAALLAMPYLR